MIRVKSYDDDTKPWVYYSQKTLLIVLKHIFMTPGQAKMNIHLKISFFPKKCMQFPPCENEHVYLFSIENQKLACLEVTLFRTSNVSLGSVK